MWLRVRVMKIHSSIFLCINITFILSTECSVTENDSPWTTEDTLNILDYFIDVRETSFEESLLSKNRMPSIYSPHAQQFSRSWSAVSPALGGRCLLFPCRLQRAQGRLGHARLEALKEPPQYSLRLTLLPWLGGVYSSIGAQQVEERCYMKRRTPGWVRVWGQSFLLLHRRMSSEGQRLQWVRNYDFLRSG